jgi:hypothetical protein
MLQERSIGIIEEIGEVQSLAELKALWCFGQSSNNELADAEFVDSFRAAAARLRSKEEVAMPKTEDLEARVAELLAQVEALKPGAKANPPVQPVVRGSKRYKLLSDDVSWSTKPQVHSLMAILRAHVEVGGTLDEASIVAAMEANVAVLETRQGGKRIWDYYKGRGADGLLLHGNVEIV